LYTTGLVLALIGRVLNHNWVGCIKTQKIVTVGRHITVQNPLQIIIFVA